jgi:hypothetical protein
VLLSKIRQGLDGMLIRLYKRHCGLLQLLNLSLQNVKLLHPVVWHGLYRACRGGQSEHSSPLSEELMQ